MSTPMRITQLFVSDEASPGTPQALLAAHAFKLSKEGAPPTRIQGPINQQLVDAKADYGGSVRAAAQYWQGALPPLYVSYPATSGVLDGDGPIKHMPFFKAAGYQREVIAAAGGNAGANRFYSSPYPNVSGAGLAASTLRMIGASGDGSGKLFKVDSARMQLRFMFGTELPHNIVANFMGGYEKPSPSDNESATYNYDPLVVSPAAAGVSVQIVETSLRDSGHEEVYDTDLVLSAGEIVSPFAPAPRSAFRPNGFLHPCYMTPGQPQASFRLELPPESDLPIETWWDEIEHIRLRLRLIYDDTAGDGGVLRHVVRGLCLAAEPGIQSGPPISVQIQATGSSTDAGLPSHEFEFAEEIADLSALADDPA